MSKLGDHDAAGTKLPAAPAKKFGDHDLAGSKYGAKHHHGLIIQRRRVTGNLKPMRFVSLHHHSTFSYLDGYQLPEAHIRRATELNMGAMAMTEHGNIDSHVKFEKAADGSGVKPIFGCEVYMPSGPDWSDDDAETQRKHHLTLLAQTPEGYRNLLEIVSQSWRNFYHEPTVTWSNLLKHRRGLVVLSGCQGSLLFCSAVGGKGIAPEDASYKRALRVAQMFKRAFGSNYFIEVQAFPELRLTREFNGTMAGRLARAVGTRLVATMDCHYTLLEEAEVQMILHNLRPGNRQTIEEQAREWGYDVPLCPPPNDNSIYRRLRATGMSRDEAIEAIVSTEEIGAACNASLPKLPMVRFPVPPGYADVKAYWREQLKEGWKLRGFDRLRGAERRRAKEQLAHEMEMIESKDFVDYFMLVAAGVQYIKGLDIPVGPARGSAAASLAAFLLRITEVNPLLFPLLTFDRFISVDRHDLPDIDLDFPSEARPLLREFYSRMLGDDCVSNIGTFIYFKNKLAVDDVARVFQIPKGDTERLKDFLIERSSGDMRASSTIEDTVDQFPAAAEIFERHPDLMKSQWIEGMVKGFGVHAAGLVLSNQPITTVTAVAERELPKGSGNVVQVVALDKDDAERQGMVKMDFLGLNTMSMLWDIQKRLGWSIDRLYSIPLDDPAVYDAFKETDVTGIFQFEGRAQRYVCASLQPERFSEIMDCNALSRPGPLHNGAAREYAEIKHGGKAAESLHPALSDILGPTQFQIVYQEQILKIAGVIGGFNATGVAEIRKIIAKKHGEQAFNRKRDEFVAGARTLADRTDYPPMDDEIALRIWGDMITSGAYAFNAAHCAAYGLIGVYTMYFKVHYPDVFYAAALAEAVSNKDRTRQLLRDADKHGVRVLTPSVARSESSWAPVRKPLRKGGTRALSPPTIRAGFQQIEGVGEKTAELIVQTRDEQGLTGWPDLGRVKGIGPKSIEKIMAWVNDDDPFGAFALDKNIAEVDRQLRAGELGPGLPIPTHTAADLAADESQGKALQVVWLGTFVKRNIRDIFEQNRARGNELDPKAVKDAHLNEWALLTAEDRTDQLLITIDRWKYPAMKDALFNFRMGHDLMLIKAVKPRSSAVRKLNVKKLWVIDPDE